MSYRIGIIGGNEGNPHTLTLAREVGEEVARRDLILVCGGRGGVMEAACRGAKAHGGLTVGILPGDSAAEANPYVDVPIVTGMGLGRNIIVVRTANAIIALEGSFGTLSEISHGLQLDLPVIALRSWWDMPLLRRADSPVQAVDMAVNLIREN